MLTRLQICNVVLIEKLDLDFSEGLTIFSGETGAGKSILLDSLGLVLGAKAETGLIKAGADKLSVVAEFELKDKKSHFYRICNDNEIEADGCIIIKRTLTHDGKSKIFLNDQPVTLRLLKELGSHLVEIHGQFDNQGLLNSATHIDVLDSFGGYDKDMAALSKAFGRYKDVQKKLKQAIDSHEKTLRDEEILTHYKNELEAMNVRAGEEKELTVRRAEMMHAEKLLENLNAAYQALHGEGIAAQVRHAMSAIAKANVLTENKFENIASALDSVLVELDEAVCEIEKASEDICLSKNEIDALEERLFALKDLARKHGCGIDDLPHILEEISTKLKFIEKNNDDIIVLKKELLEAEDDYKTKALQVRENRRKTAEILSTKVQKELEFLKMGKAEFRVCLEQADEQSWSEKGMDLVCFEVKTNAGQPFGPLSKIASGGELARFMLALKVNLALSSGLETLIFDEIDSGIGGATAEAVGNRLKKLSADVQVMAVTHAPQVAAFSDTHFKVSKQTTGNVTTTNVVCLSETEKKEEIARMLSGEIISDEARAAANKLMEQE